jgi:hypothetical protein
MLFLARMNAHRPTVAWEAAPGNGAHGGFFSRCQTVVRHASIRWPALQNATTHFSHFSEFSLFSPQKK